MVVWSIRPSSEFGVKTLSKARTHLESAMKDVEGRDGRNNESRNETCLYPAGAQTLRRKTSNRTSRHRIASQQEIRLECQTEWKPSPRLLDNVAEPLTTTQLSACNTNLPIARKNRFSGAKFPKQTKLSSKLQYSFAISNPAKTNCNRQMQQNLAKRT